MGPRHERRNRQEPDRLRIRRATHRSDTSSSPAVVRAKPLSFILRFVYPNIEVGCIARELRSPPLRFHSKFSGVKIFVLLPSIQKILNRSISAADNGGHESLSLF
jgi:hypothetical protein